MKLFLLRPGVIALSLRLAAGGDTGAAEANYDEAKVPAYTLPDPLKSADGKTVTSSKDWLSVRRAEVLELFAREMFGHSPGRPRNLRYEVDVERNVLGGIATRKQVTIHFTERADGPRMDLLVYLPTTGAGPHPTFAGLNFEGNHAVTRDPGVRLSTAWMRNDEKEGRVANRATEKSRGSESSRWPVETILSRGYAVATAYYGDLEPDHPQGWETGVRSVFSPSAETNVVAERAPISTMKPDDWGAIGAWAWGLSRAMDYFESDADIDAKKVAVLGHSRLGKTSLWAGATDERFAIVISNDSGCGGAALSRRAFGETVERINNAFPHWFCTNFKKYNGKEAELPIDQHEIIALMAPRPVYIASAEKDLWADPRGEFLSGKGAEPVYALFGKAGLGVSEMPGVNQPVGDFIGYHIRTGIHDVTDYDWARYLDFADRHWGKSAARP